MVADARTAFALADPHVRQIDPWRDGRAVANLLEASFRDEIIDDSGLRLIHALRNYGMFDALTFGFGTGFVWIEEGELLANASVQRNMTRKDTWIIGNVATHAAHRNRGIGRAVVQACIRYAAARGARYIALQADETNKPALHLYEKIGFDRLGRVAHYLRAPARYVDDDDDDTDGIQHRVRRARWSDHAAVWALTQRNLPDRLGYAEPFDANAYRLGFRWSLMNALNGNVEHWLVADSAERATLLGAVRTRVSFEGSNHQLELMLDERATLEDGVALVASGLHRLEDYASKPIYAAQARLGDAPHTALEFMGFQPTRTLVHMRLELESE